MNGCVQYGCRDRYVTNQLSWLCNKAGDFSTQDNIIKDGSVCTLVVVVMLCETFAAYYVQFVHTNIPVVTICAVIAILADHFQVKHVHLIQRYLTDIEKKKTERKELYNSNVQW